MKRKLIAKFGLKDATVCLKAATQLAQGPNRRFHHRRHYQLKTSASCGPGAHIWKIWRPDVRNDQGWVYLKHVLNFGSKSDSNLQLFLKITDINTFALI